MKRAAPAKIWAAADLAALARAVELLEGEGLAAKIGRRAGEPARKLLSRLPGPLAKGLDLAIERAALGALDLAVKSLDTERKRPPTPRLASALAGLSGGLSGLIGLAALPFELPLTTLLMLRSIADIARHMGEDLTQLEARLACVAVFAFGTGEDGVGMGEAEVGYFASRALLSKLASEASSLMLERGGAAAAAPALNAFAAEVTTRYGVTVWERAAVSAAPLIGAVGGAALNAIFTNHFNNIAWGHFTVRRLERIYGAAAAKRHYQKLRATRPVKPRKTKIPARRKTPNA